MDIRSAVIGAWGIGDLMTVFYATKDRGPVGRLKNLGLMIYYGLQCGRMTWRTEPMDVDKLVDAWIEAAVGMSTAHTKDEFDRHDFRADELLSPILTAPIKQVREFYEKLKTKLAESPGVPWIVAQGFEAWGKYAVADAKDEGVKRLKNRLAGEIAELVELGVRDQIPEAIKRALRWRDEETLTEVRDVLKAGAKPKLVGRQSCLFLRVGRGKKCREVML